MEEGMRFPPAHVLRGELSQGLPGRVGRSLGLLPLACQHMQSLSEVSGALELTYASIYSQAWPFLGMGLCCAATPAESTAKLGWGLGAHFWPLLGLSVPIT